MWNFVRFVGAKRFTTSSHPLYIVLKVACISRKDFTKHLIYSRIPLNALWNILHFTHNEDFGTNGGQTTCSKDMHLHYRAWGPNLTNVQIMPLTRTFEHKRWIEVLPKKGNRNKAHVLQWKLSWWCVYLLREIAMTGGAMRRTIVAILCILCLVHMK